MLSISRSSQMSPDFQVALKVGVIDTAFTPAEQGFAVTCISFRYSEWGLQQSRRFGSLLPSISPAEATGSETEGQLIDPMVASLGPFI